MWKAFIYLSVLCFYASEIARVLFETFSLATSYKDLDLFVLAERLQTVHRLIWTLEYPRRLTASDGKEDSSLPHVDNLASSNKMMGGGMSMKKEAYQDLVLVGGGHAHAFVVKMFGMKPEPGVRLTLISDTVETPYSGMLPGYVAGKYSKETCHLDTMRMCQFAGGRFVRATCLGIDPKKKLVLLSPPHPPIPYDVLSINVGISPALPALGGGDLVIPVKPISKFDQGLGRLVADLEAFATRSRAMRVAVVGGGAGGVEIAFALNARLKRTALQVGALPPQIMLISRSPSLCPSHDPAVGRLVLTRLTERGVRVELGQHIVRVQEDASGNKLLIGKNALDGKEDFDLAVDDVVWCASAAAQPWLAASGLAVDANGFAQTTDELNCIGFNDVFAVGDCATQVNHPRAKSGVFAVRAGPPLAKNLRLTLQGKPESRESHVPQTVFLGLIGTANESALASRGAYCSEGPWLWTMKDWIDRTWMNGYTKMLSAQAPPPEIADPSSDPRCGRAVQGVPRFDRVVSAGEMRCSGCAAKVGPLTLSKAMADLEPCARPEVVVGLEAPDDCALVRYGAAPGALVASTMDFFPAMLEDEYVFARIAVNHALSDLHAKGIAPVAALCLALVPPPHVPAAEAPRAVLDAAESFQVRQLQRLMKGTNDQLVAEKCALVGGHTCESATLSLGLSVQGSILSRELWMSKRARAVPSGGGSLILTKPLGTAVILAAHAKLMAKGVWVDEALTSMSLSNGPAGALIHEFGATACTDVTGFGLLGHLWEMLALDGRSEQRRAARVALARVPYLRGARECVCAGVASSLAPSNAKGRYQILDDSSRDAFDQDPRYHLLFDPQTGGGLLCVVPDELAPALVRKLRDAGYDRASVIGAVSEEPGRVCIVDQ